MVSRLDSLWELYLYYGFVIGFGVSGTDVVLLSTVARWFTRMRGMMSGIIKVGTGLGMVIVPLFLKWLMTLLTGEPASLSWVSSSWLPTSFWPNSW